MLGAEQRHKLAIHVALSGVVACAGAVGHVGGGIGGGWCGFN